MEGRAFQKRSGQPVVGVEFFPSLALFRESEREKEKKRRRKQQTQTPPFRVIYPYGQAFFTGCNSPLPGLPSGMPASGVWNSPVSLSSKGKDEQWASPGTNNPSPCFPLPYFPHSSIQPQAIPVTSTFYSATQYCPSAARFFLILFLTST